MSLRQELQKRFLFDLWSTRKLVDSIQKSAPFNDESACLAFLSHIVNVQHIWYERVIDLNLNIVEPWHEYSVDEIKPEARNAHQLWIDLIGDHDMDLAAKIHFQTTGGVNRVLPFSEICNHLIVHGQHHRAQIMLFLSRSDISLPRMDYDHYLNDEKKLTQHL